jgi:hypothetical protein
MQTFLVSSGAGSRFTLHLSSAVCNPVPAASCRRRLRVWIRISASVEDDLRAQDDVGVGRPMGCRPIVAQHRRVLSQVAAERRRPDLVLADYRLGDGLPACRCRHAPARSVGSIPAIR